MQSSYNMMRNSRAALLVLSILLQSCGKKTSHLAMNCGDSVVEVSVPLTVKITPSITNNPEEENIPAPEDDMSWMAQATLCATVTTQENDTQASANPATPEGERAEQSTSTTSNLLECDGPLADPDSRLKDQPAREKQAVDRSTRVKTVLNDYFDPQTSGQEQTTTSAEEIELTLANSDGEEEDFELTEERDGTEVKVEEDFSSPSGPIRQQFSQMSRKLRNLVSEGLGYTPQKPPCR